MRALPWAVALALCGGAVEAHAQPRPRAQRATRAARASASVANSASAANSANNASEAVQCGLLGETVRCASARAVSGLPASAHLIPNVLTTELAQQLSQRASGALVSEVIRRVQSMPYARGTVAPATIAGLALAGGAAAMDCDERAFVAASVINAIGERERVVEVSPGVRVPVARAAVVTIPRIKHAVLLLELSERPERYQGPLALVGGAMYAPVECTAVLAVGEFNREWDAVLRDPAAETVVTRAASGAVSEVPVRGPFRGQIARPSQSAEGFRWAEAVLGQNPR